jgi:hypothetical protein
MALHYAILAIVIIIASPHISNFLSGYIKLTGVFGTYVVSFISLFALLILADQISRRALKI